MKILAPWMAAPVVLVLCSLTSCNGWTSFPNQNVVGDKRSRTIIASFSSMEPPRESTLLLFAKPPPISNFDLEAIEAFENEIMDAITQEDDHRFDMYDSDDGPFISDTNDGDFQGTTLSVDVQTFTVPENLHGKRIDAVLAAMIQPSASRSICGNLVAEGRVWQIQDEEDNLLLLDRKSIKVDAGTILRVELPNQNEFPDRIVAQKLPLSVLYEDEHMIVLNKAAGMVVHPGAGNWEGTVVNALAYYLAYNSTFGPGDFVKEDGTLDVVPPVSTTKDDPLVDTDGETSTLLFRPGIVHRLDKGTTGILVVAKTTRALSKLSEAFASRDVKKTYLAVTVGNPGKQVVIDKPIGRHPIHRQRMRVVPDPHRKDSSGTTPQQRQRLKMMEVAATNSPRSVSLSQAGRRALSYVDTLAFDGKLALARVRIETGRTHQIRVHLQDRQTPIYGDDVYGIPEWNKRLTKSHGIERPLLHAHRLELRHPITNEEMVFEAPMAEDMTTIARIIWPDGLKELPRAFG